MNVQLLSTLPQRAWEGASVGIVHFAGGYAKPWNPQLPRKAPTREKLHALNRERRVRRWWNRSCYEDVPPLATTAAAFTGARVEDLDE